MSLSGARPIRCTPSFSRYRAPASGPERNTSHVLVRCGAVKSSTNSSRSFHRGTEYAAACALPSPVITNFAVRNCPPGTSFQPLGTFHLGLPVLDTGTEPALVGAAEISGCPAGKLPSANGDDEVGSAATASPAVNWIDLRNSMKLGFSRATS